MYHKVSEMQVLLCVSIFILNLLQYLPSSIVFVFPCYNINILSLSLPLDSHDKLISENLKIKSKFYSKLMFTFSLGYITSKYPQN